MVFPILLLVFCIFLGIIFPNIGNKWFRSIGSQFARLAQHRTLSIVLIGLLTFTAEVIFCMMTYIPVPGIHDEFAYLLTADTFAHGRLTNETHPMWEHFESYHIFHKPTYQGKYPPGQGMVLAAGQVLFGLPIVGVWFSIAAAVSAITWMLYGWLPPRWALLGGLLTLIRPIVFIGWGQTYWGGAVAMTGGALIFGALPRLQQSFRSRDAILMGLGLVLLANSRPYEGLVASLPVAVLLFISLVRTGRHSMLDKIKSVILPIALILVTAVAWMGYYNYRVTGNALTMPYQVWSKTRGISLSDTLFFSEKLNKPNKATLPINPQQVEEFNSKKNLPVPKKYGNIPVSLKCIRLFMSLLGPLLALPFLAAVPILFSKKLRLATVVSGLVLAAILIQNTSAHAHYLAPIFGLLILIATQGLRMLRLVRIHNRATGRFLVRVIPLIALMSFSSYCLDTWVKGPDISKNQWNFWRAQIIEQLEKGPDQHLIIVRYHANHLWHYEWVYNGAEIDSEKVIWARDLGKTRNLQLLKHFKHRKIWLIEPDAKKVRPIRIRNLKDLGYTKT